MKKLLALSMLLGSLVFAAPSAEAKSDNLSKSAVGEVNAVQVRNVYRVRRNGRVARVVTRTRLIRAGYRTYRETYRITYLPNGRTRTQIISRARIR